MSRLTIIEPDVVKKAVLLAAICVVIVSACIAADYFSVANALLIKITDKNLDTINRQTMARIIQLQDLTKYEPVLQKKITDRVISLYSKDVKFEWSGYEKDICRKTIENNETSVAQKNIAMFVRIRYADVIRAYIDTDFEARHRIVENAYTEINYWISVNNDFLKSIDADMSKMDKKQQSKIVLDQIAAVNKELSWQDKIPMGLFFVRLSMLFAKDFI